MKTIVPQADPKSSYFAHKAEIDFAVANVLHNGHYILGQEVRLFEEEFGNYIHSKYAISVASGSDALFIALLACGVQQGDIVITVSHTAIADLIAIELCQATPLLIDIDPETYVMDLNQLERTLQALTISQKHHLKAIIPVHLYGNPVDMPELLKLCKNYGLYIIEDSAQAHGARIGERKVGAWADLGVFSFYPTKNLGAMGDGGMIVTDNADLASRVQGLRQYGWHNRYVSESFGVNSRLDELQAAILRVKLKYLDEENSFRNKIAGQYSETLDRNDIVLPRCRHDCYHVFHQYVIRVQRRDQLRNFLLDKGISTNVHYPVPVHLQPLYRNKYGYTRLPETEKITPEILSLPIHPYMEEDTVAFIAKNINSWENTQI